MKVKERVTPPADCFGPCGLGVSQHRLWASLPWGRPPPLPGAAHRQGDGNQPRLGRLPALLPHGRCRLGSGPFGPDRDLPPSPDRSLPHESPRSVCLGLRNSVPAVRLLPSLVPFPRRVPPFLRLHGQQVEVLNMFAQASRELLKYETGKNILHVGRSHSKWLLAKKFCFPGKERHLLSPIWHLGTCRLQDARASTAHELGRASFFQCGVYIRQCKLPKAVGRLFRTGAMFG